MPAAPNTPTTPTLIRALQIAEALDLKGLEREDAFSKNPLGFRTPSGAMALLFKTGAVAFVGMTPIEEEEIVRGLSGRLVSPLSSREVESAQIVVKAEEDDQISTTGLIQVRALDSNRLLLIAEALAVSAALAYDERRIAGAFERIEPVAANLLQRRLPPGPQSALLEQIGEALAIQQRLANRASLDDKPDVLWDHPELERFWAKLVDEYDLGPRARAIERKLVAIRESADTITDLISTRTSHRLEWYIIILIAIELVLGFFDRVWKLGHG